MELDINKVQSSLRIKGFVEFREGDHIRYVYYYNGLETSIWTCVSHHSSNIKEPLINKMKRQLKLTKNDFINLVRCPFTKEMLQKFYEDNNYLT